MHCNHERHLEKYMEDRNYIDTLPPKLQRIVLLLAGDGEECEICCDEKQSEYCDFCLYAFGSECGKKLDRCPICRSMFELEASSSGLSLQQIMLIIVVGSYIDLPQQIYFEVNETF